MIIDAHTHIFPKEVAAAMFMNPRLQPSQNLSFYTDATKRGLLASMKEAKIDYSLVLPVVRAPISSLPLMNLPLRSTVKTVFFLLAASILTMTISWTNLPILNLWG